MDPCSRQLLNSILFALDHTGETSKAVLEVSAMQLEIDSLKKQLDEHAKAAALDEDYRCVSPQSPTLAMCDPCQAFSKRSGEAL